MTTIRPEATTSTTRQNAGTSRVVPQTKNSSPLRHTPRWMPGRSTAGATFDSTAGASGSRAANSSGWRALLGRQERERDLRRLALFAAQARPERGVDDRRDRERRRRIRDRCAVGGARRGDVAGKVALHRVGDESGGGVGWLNHLVIGC